MRPLRHTRLVATRHVRAFLRQPAWVGITLVQPVIWLLVFGALFKRVVEIPGFHGGSYIEFLTPGVLVMTAISSAFMQQSLVPGWIHWISRFIPANWAIQAGRSASIEHVDWSLVGSRLGFLAAFLLLSVLLADRAFRSYQRSL